MATYHGCVAAMCCECGFTTRDEATIEAWNDMALPCFKCSAYSTIWVNNDGTVIYTKDWSSELVRFQLDMKLEIV